MIKKCFYYISLLILLISCEKFFHQEDLLISKIENINELEQAISGSYGLLAKAYNSYNGDGFYMANLKGDDINIRPVSYFRIYSCDEDRYWVPDDTWYDREDEYRNDSWKNLYRLIVSVNNIITQFPHPLSTEKAYRELIGEAFFIRAYCYFRLVRTYEKILLVDDIEINYAKKVALPQDVYEFIKKDLELAQKLLPGNHELSRIPGVTPHRGVAKALLAEVYLNWAGYPVMDQEKYTLAALSADELIDSAEYFGFKLLSDFVTLWDNSDYYNRESIFSLHYSDPVYALAADEINQVYWGRYWNNVKLYLQLDLVNSVEILFFPCEMNFYNDYPRGYRKDITFFTRNFLVTQYDNNREPIEGYYDTIITVNHCGRIAYRKFLYNASIVDHNLNSAYSFKDYRGNSKVYLFRYAHTLLTYAEASARSGNLNTKSYECVNKIRRRARHLDNDQPSQYDLNAGLSVEAFLDSVVWERAWEFAGEPEGRWFDLVRLEKVEELNYLRDPNENGPPELPFTKEDYFFSIPEEEYYLNLNF